MMHKWLRMITLGILRLIFFILSNLLELVTPGAISKTTPNNASSTTTPWPPTTSKPSVAGMTNSQNSKRTNFTFLENHMVECMFHTLSMLFILIINAIQEIQLLLNQILRASWLEMVALIGNMTPRQRTWRWHIIIHSIQAKFGTEFNRINAYRSFMTNNGAVDRSVTFVMDLEVISKQQPIK
jgi:hypothetical protein